MTRDHAERVHPQTVEAWHAWLDEHAERGHGVWLVTWKPSCGHPDLTYEQSVEVALCHGWIDSTSRRLDDDRGMLWFAPRRPRSGWSRPNKERLARLEAAGELRARGTRVVAAAQADGSWTLLDDVEALRVPDDLAAALSERPGAREHWDALPRPVRRAALVQLVEARRPQTRARRVLEVAEVTARGDRP